MRFFYKIIKDLEKSNLEIKSNIKSLENEIRQINCQHKKTEFFNYSYALRSDYFEKCSNCNKHLQIFSSEINYRKAKAEKLNEQLELETTKIKKIVIHNEGLD